MEREKPADSRDNCQESIAAGSTALMGRPGNQPEKKRRNTALRADPDSIPGKCQQKQETCQVI